MKNLYHNHFIVRLLCKVLVVILIIVVAAILFLKVWPAFGKKPTKEQQKQYAKRASNYVDGKFQNEEVFTSMKGEKEVDDKKLSTKETRPKDTLPQKKSAFQDNPDVSEVNVTWFGHSSLLIQMHGKNILVDPVFSQFSSPVQFAGPKRYSVPETTVADLPDIDILIISHDHYDHLDWSTIKQVDDKVKQYMVPLGVENHLERFGVSKDKISNLAWWESIEVDGLSVSCTPGQHFSGRGLDDQYQTLWASWVLKDEYHQIYESGDSGFGGHFKEIHEKYGDFDFAMLDCAQYNVAWSKVHMTPEESYEAAGILGAKVVMPIHWGAFVLSDHGWDDPVSRYIKASEDGKINVVTPMLCETMELSHYQDYQTHWWENVQ